MSAHCLRPLLQRDCPPELAVLMRLRGCQGAGLTLTACMPHTAIRASTSTLSHPAPAHAPIPCRTGVPIKKMLIPMSFATVLGGTCTLIGTSTNLVVSGLQNEKFQDEQFGGCDPRALTTPKTTPVHPL